MSTPFNPPQHSVFQRTAFLITLGLITLGFLFMIRHFLLTLFLAGVFTGLSYPLFLWLSQKLRSRVAAALATLLILLLLIVLPASAVIMVAYQQAFALFTGFDYQALPSPNDPILRDLQQRYPV
jgi:predicted PurR-regulated permease PerM